MQELHKNLYNVAVKLSIYSSILDFGLAMSTALLGQGYLPGKTSAFLITGFDYAITYVTFAILGLFTVALFLKHKSTIINIPVVEILQAKKKSVKTPIIRVLEQPQEKKAEVKIYIKSPENLVKRTPESEEQLLSIKNSKNESFLKINGVWYKAGSSRFERVPLPDYD